MVTMLVVLYKTETPMDRVPTRGGRTWFIWPACEHLYFVTPLQNSDAEGPSPVTRRPQVVYSTCSERASYLFCDPSTKQRRPGIESCQEEAASGLFYGQR